MHSFINVMFSLRMEWTKWYNFLLNRVTNSTIVIPRDSMDVVLVITVIKPNSYRPDYPMNMEKGIQSFFAQVAAKYIM